MHRKQAKAAAAGLFIRRYVARRGVVLTRSLSRSIRAKLEAFARTSSFSMHEPPTEKQGKSAVRSERSKANEEEEEEDAGNSIESSRVEYRFDDHLDRRRPTSTKKRKAKKKERKKDSCSHIPRLSRVQHIGIHCIRTAGQTDGAIKSKQPQKKR